MSPRRKEANEKIQEISQEKIMNAAFELFAQKGYEGTSIGEIANKADISKGLIYHYFKSKQEILKKLVQGLIQKLPNLLMDRKDTNPEGYIQNLIEHSFYFILNHTRINRLLIGLVIQPKVIEGLKSELDEAKKQWMGTLAEMFGKLGYENPLAEAYLLGAIFDGVSIGYQAFEKDYPIETIKEIIIKRYKY